ncbi:MAG: preprotein translocase subunit SecE [Verrucomicrobiia bacterium]
MIAGSWFWTLVTYGLLAVVVVVLLMFRARILTFGEQVVAELKKCSWPWDLEQTGFRRFKNLIDSTVVVSVVTLLLAAYTTIFDFLINKLVGFLVKF